MITSPPSRNSSSVATHTFFTTEADVHKRLDLFLLERLPAFSRSRLQSWIKQGNVQADGKAAKASMMLRGGECIEVEPANLPPLKATAEDLPVEILYQDASVIAINKPAGLVVHAGAGNHTGTLVNRLVHHFGTQSQGGLSKVGGDLRPGIVHRLDKETSGVLLVARTDAAHRALAAQFSGRTVAKTYLALVHGHPKLDQGRITKPIARDPEHRTRMTAKLGTGREALTDYRVLHRYETSAANSPGEDRATSRKFAYLEVRIGTGRTHQIRVHLSSLGHPVAGDRLYGAPALPLPDPMPRKLFLHAWRIRFESTATGQPVEVEAPLPSELQEWLNAVSQTAE